jgi:hypothetical protein
MGGSSANITAAQPPPVPLSSLSIDCDAASTGSGNAATIARTASDSGVTPALSPAASSRAELDSSLHSSCCDGVVSGSIVEHAAVIESTASSSAAAATTATTARADTQSNSS